MTTGIWSAEWIEVKVDMATRRNIDEWRRLGIKPIVSGGVTISCHIFLEDELAMFWARAEDGRWFYLKNWAD
jgi:hypothetical protein